MDDKGYITLETSLVMLTAVYAIFFLMMLAVYENDSLMAEAMAQRTLETCLRDDRGVNQKEVKELLLAFSEEMKEKGIYVSDAECTLTEDGDELLMTYSAKYSCPLKEWLFWGRTLLIEGRIERKTVRPQEMLRLLQGAIKGFGG